MAEIRTCGEARLVYVKANAPGGQVLSTSNRMTMIFEASVPNPAQSLGSRGCLPVAQFWAGLTTQSGAQLAQSLSGFFLQGLPEFNVKPIVSLDNYGNPLGQVRINMFVNTQPDSLFVWQQRQFAMEKFSREGVRIAGVRFRPSPVDDNALPDLYRDPTAGESPELAALRGDFWNYHVDTRVPQLLELDIQAKATGVPLTDARLIAGMRSPVPRRFNGFESTASIVPPAETNAISPTLRARIAAAVASIPLLWSVNAT